MAELAAVYGNSLGKISSDRIKSIVAQTHFTATEKRYIRQGLAEGFHTWKSARKTFEIKKVENNQITIAVIDYYTDMIGRRVRQVQTGIVTLKD